MSDNKTNIKQFIPDIRNLMVMGMTKSQTPITKKNIFSIFNPIDVVVYKILNICKPFFKFIGFKSEIIGCVSLILYALSFYSSYNRNINLTWIFLLLGLYVSFLDNLFVSENLNDKELVRVLIKTISCIFMFVFINSNIIGQTHQAKYIILFMIILLIITEHHTRKIINGHNNVSNINNKLNIIKTVGIIFLIIIIYFIIKQSKIIRDENNISTLDVFIKK